MWKKFGTCPACGKRVVMNRLDNTIKPHKYCEVKGVSGKDVKLEWRDKE